MIDLHCHILPGIDDGPQTFEESIAMAKLAASQGTRTIVATPHVNARYDNRAETIHALVGDLNTRLRDASVDVRIQVGAEISMPLAARLPPEELANLTLGGGGWLLLEPPFAPFVNGLDDTVWDLMRQGHRVVIAHPERCPGLSRDRGMLRDLVASGVLLSLTAGALTGRFGDSPRRFALQLAKEGLVHNVSSDAHDTERRPPTIAEHVERAGLGDMADWLTELVPSAILSGEDIPARPYAHVDRGTRRKRFFTGWRSR